MNLVQFFGKINFRIAGLIFRGCQNCSAYADELCTYDNVIFTQTHTYTHIHSHTRTLAQTQILCTIYFSWTTKLMKLLLLVLQFSFSFAFSLSFKQHFHCAFRILPFLIHLRPFDRRSQFALDFQFSIYIFFSFFRRVGYVLCFTRFSISIVANVCIILLFI